MLIFEHTPGERRYYFYKYPMFALLLLSSACVAILPAVVARLVAARQQRRDRWRLAFLAAACACLLASASQKWNTALAPHWRGYAERAWAKPPYNVNEDNLPLADLGAWRRIETVLETEHKRF